MGMATQNSFHAAHVIDRSINEFQHHSHHTYVLICSPCFNLDTLPVKLLITIVIFDRIYVIKHRNNHIYQEIGI